MEYVFKGDETKAARWSMVVEGFLEELAVNEDVLEAIVAWGDRTGIAQSAQKTAEELDDLARQAGLVDRYEIRQAGEIPADENGAAKLDHEAAV